MKLHILQQDRFVLIMLIMALAILSVASYIYFYSNGLSLAYNDARSHLDIGRRVVEGLKPGIAQLGSVWLPLTHILMSVTIWNDFMWHSGLAGTLESMIAFVGTSVLIYLYVREMNVGLLGRIVAVSLFVLNVNILYLQSTAMTELMLLLTMTAGAYYLLLWFKRDSIVYLIGSAFWIMLATLVRYDGWFLCISAAVLVGIYALRKKGYGQSEGTVILLSTLAGFGIFLWFLWNLIIFKDPFYFAFGPYSAHTQQDQLAAAGVLATKGNILFSIKVYLYALVYNSGLGTVIVGSLGAIALWLNRRISSEIKIASVVLISPLLFNIIALYLGHSVLFIQGLSGDTWFNVRYGVMMMPSLAIFVGYLVSRLSWMRWSVSAMILIVAVVFGMHDTAVTIKDAQFGSSQKNVSEVSNWLHQHAKDEPGFILISAASHDAIIFSSGLPMKKFIHEGTGAYWDSATKAPDRWARWIIMRTHSDDDLTFHLLKTTSGLQRYDLVAQYPFADIYQLKAEYVDTLHTTPILGKQK